MFNAKLAVAGPGRQGNVSLLTQYPRGSQTDQKT